jgi:triacylglycerol lipase
MPGQQWLSNMLRGCAFAYLLLYLGGVSAGATHKPTARVLNGTYYGVHNDHYGQDLFLGMPYAQQPVGDLRLRTPRSLNVSWTAPRNATEYSPACLGPGQTLGASESCLTLNVVRPSGVSAHDDLPVAGIYLPSYLHGFCQGEPTNPRHISLDLWRRVYGRALF